MARSGLPLKACGQPANLSVRLHSAHAQEERWECTMHTLQAAFDTAFPGVGGYSSHDDRQMHPFRIGHCRKVAQARCRPSLLPATWLDSWKAQRWSLPGSRDNDWSVSLLVASLEEMQETFLQARSTDVACTRGCLVGPEPPKLTPPPEPPRRSQTRICR